jgi:lipopolysaccharide export system protein LptA
MAGAAHTQQLDLAHGGPITVTANDGLEWRQNQQEVVARGQARAVRGEVTVDADQLVAHYRKKTTGGAAGQSPAPVPPTPGTPAATPTDADTSGSEIYRVEADGNVRIFTPTDRAQGDRAVYDMDQAVLVMTGHDLRLTTPNDLITAHDSLEYWSQKHMAVARGNAAVLTTDGRRIAADVLVAYTTEGQSAPASPEAKTNVRTVSGTASSEDPLAASGKLKKVEAFGNVSIRTQTDIVTGDRAVYVPETGIARLAGHVRITRGQNQLNGTEAEVNLKTGISRLLSSSNGRVAGLIVPSDASAQDPTSSLDPSRPQPPRPAAGKNKP